MDENMEYYPTVSGNESSVQNSAPEDDTLLSDIFDTLKGTQNFGTIGDYYFQALGCYLFPNFDVYEYFIDIDAVGNEWTETSDGHYILIAYLDAYEGLRSGNGEEESIDESADVPAGFSDDESLEVLESVRGLLSVIKENDTAYYGGMLERQEEMMETEQRELAYAEGTMYANITMCVLLAVIAGTFVAHAFFGRLKGG